MKKALKFYLTKLRFRSMMNRLVRLSSEAYDVNKRIQASDLPEDVKARADYVLDVYINYCFALDIKIK